MSFLSRSDVSRLARASKDTLALCKAHARFWLSFEQVQTVRNAGWQHAAWNVVVRANQSWISSQVGFATTKVVQMSCTADSAENRLGIVSSFPALKTLCLFPTTQEKTTLDVSWQPMPELRDFLCADSLRLNVSTLVHAAHSLTRLQLSDGLVHDDNDVGPSFDLSLLPELVTFMGNKAHCSRPWPPKLKELFVFCQLDTMLDSRVCQNLVTIGLPLLQVREFHALDWPNLEQAQLFVLVDVVFPWVEAETVDRLFPNAPKLRFLEIDATDKLLHRLAIDVPLTVPRLSVTDPREAFFAEDNQFSRLEQLTIDKVSDEQLMPVAKNFLTQPSFALTLKRLELSGVQGVCSVLPDILAHLANLDEFVLCHIDTPILLPRVPTLRSLRLDGCAQVRMLAPQPRLQTLHATNLDQTCMRDMLWQHQRSLLFFTWRVGPQTLARQESIEAINGFLTLEHPEPLRGISVPRLWRPAIYIRGDFNCLSLEFN